VKIQQESQHKSYNYQHLLPGCQGMCACVCVCVHDLSSFALSVWLSSMAWNSVLMDSQSVLLQLLISDLSRHLVVLSILGEWQSINKFHVVCLFLFF